MAEMSRIDDHMSRIGFGTSGVRGLVADLVPEVVAAYTRAFAGRLTNNTLAVPPATVLVGHDLRPSSPGIAATVVAVLREHGFTVSYAGALPTPALAFHALQNGWPAVVITGSHIPFDRNGIKFYRPDGEILKSDEADIVARLSDVSRTTPQTAPLPEPDSTVREAYLKRYLDFFPENMLAGRRIGVYEHSSVARDLLHELFRAFGAETLSIGRSDSFVAVDTEAVSAADQQAAFGWAMEQGFDALVSTDGDGDRPLLADETGRYFRGDALCILAARQLGAASVVTPVSTSTALELSGWFARVERTRIGSPYVIDAMNGLAGDAATHPVVGFEANGGFLLGTPITGANGTLAPLATRDSVLPVLAAMHMTCKAGKQLSSLREALPPRYTASDRLQEIDRPVAEEFLRRLAAEEAARNWLTGLGLKLGKLDLTDGVRMTTTDGDVVHLRLSGNAPEMRCYAETADPQASAALAARALEHVAERDLG